MQVGICLNADEFSKVYQHAACNLEKNSAPYDVSVPNATR